MTVALSTATPSAAPAKGSESSAKPSGDAANFDKLMGSTDQVEGTETPLAAQPVDPKSLAPAALSDQTLEALLQSLRTTLLPAAVLSGKSASKPGDPAKPDSKAKEGEKDDAPVEGLANLVFAQLLPAQATPKASTRISLDDVSVKPDARSPLPTADLTALSALATPPPLPADLMTLTDPTALSVVAQPDRAAASLDRLVDTARDAAWLDRLSQDIAASAGSGDKLSFRMLPPSLGALDVSVERQAAGLSVSMTTHTPEARNLIADSRQQMVDGLKAQGVPLVQFNLTTTSEEQAGHRPPTFFNHLIEVAAPAGTDLAAQPVETMAERMGRFA